MPQLSIIVPVLAEAANIPSVVEALERSLAGLDWEVVFVDDDSGDGSPELLRSIAQQKPYVRGLRRIRRRGLASACLEGMLATSSPYLAVMDGDLQHDETLLPRMLALASEQNLDIVVASRNTAGGGMGEFGERRQFLSRLGARLGQRVCGCRLSDPLSGFFLLRREFLDEVVHRVSGIGFKILVDLLASARRPVRLREIPYTFRARRRGASKLDVNVGLEYLYLVAEKWLGNYVPVRFVVFTLMGLAGVVLHLAVLGVLLLREGFSFPAAQGLAALAAINLNFFLNNMFTYRDLRLRGGRIITGLVWFNAACAVGAWINVAIGQSLYRQHVPWYVAGAAGLLVGAVWNYGVTTVTTWRHGRG